MKLFAFPTPLLERAIAKRVLTLSPESREWFSHRWKQKAYKKAFLDNKAGPLVYLLAKGKTMENAEFNDALQKWSIMFYPTEIEVLMPLIEGDGLLQLMQKKVPAERIAALKTHLLGHRMGPMADAPPSEPLHAD